MTINEQIALEKAVSCHTATATQLAIIIAHLERLSLQINRYQAGSWEYCLRMLEMQKWLEVSHVLTALYAGKTVQPS